MFSRRQIRGDQKRERFDSCRCHLFASLNLECWMLPLRPQHHLAPTAAWAVPSRTTGVGRRPRLRRSARRQKVTKSGTIYALWAFSSLWYSAVGWQKRAHYGRLISHQYTVRLEVIFPFFLPWADRPLLPLPLTLLYPDAPRTRGERQMSALLRCEMTLESPWV
jgi:hypothetical protein